MKTKWHLLPDDPPYVGGTYWVASYRKVCDEGREYEKRDIEIVDYDECENMWRYPEGFTFKISKDGTRYAWADLELPIFPGALIPGYKEKAER